MMAYGAAESYDCGGCELRVALNLGYLQRLRVLEIVRWFRELRNFETKEDFPWHQREENWLPETVRVAASSSMHDEDRASEQALTNAAAHG